MTRVLRLRFLNEQIAQATLTALLPIAASQPVRVQPVIKPALLDYEREIVIENALLSDELLYDLLIKHDAQISMSIQQHIVTPSQPSHRFAGIETTNGGT